MAKIWGISGLYSATFTVASSTSYMAGFTVTAKEKPSISVALFNPNTSFPHPVIWVTGYGSSIDRCNTPLIDRAYPDGNMWLMSTVTLDNSPPFGVLMGGARQDNAYTSVNWSRSDFVSCGCSTDSCKVDCANSPDGFCCIDHSFTNRLLAVLQG